MEAELYHHGILGQRWGVRRFQNFDGSLTSLGFNHRNIRESRFNFNDLKNSATSFINNNKNKSFSEMKIDALDYMNRKGFLGLLDANADAPFKAISQGKGKAGIQQEIIDNYKGKGSDPFEFMTKLSRNMDYTTGNIKTKEKESRKFIDEIEGSFVKDIITGTGQNAKIDHVYEKIRSVDYHPNEFAGMENKQTFQDRFDAGMKKANFSYEDWGKSVLERSGKSLEDKKLGMISKDARDIERATVGKTFVDSLRTSGGTFNTHGEYDVGKITDAYYNTEGRGANKKAFTGKKYELGESYTSASGQVIQTVGSYTKEYIKYQSDLHMPSNYSHVTDTPSHDFVDTTAKMFEDKWTMSHSDLSEDFLMHHGIMGMHWGERKYQNKDGSLTEEGRKHYGVGPAREFAKKIGATAKKASETISTAARKTFKPTEADMNEKLAKAYEKKRIQDKKNQLRELQGKNKRIKDMSSQEVWEEIQARNNQRTLERMRRDASALHKGTDFIAKTAGLATTPVRELAGFGLSLAKDNVAYGINRAAKSAIDDAVFAASKKRRLENRTELEKLRDDSETNKLRFEENTRGLREQNEIQRMKNNAALGDLRTAHEAKKLRNEMDDFDSKMSLREMNNARERTKAERDAAVNFLERQVAMGSESASTYAAERLARMKKNSPGGGGGQNQNQQGKKDNNYNN